MLGLKLSPIFREVCAVVRAAAAVVLAGAPTAAAV